MGKKEVIMTKEQAKLAKVQKGYVLEPVIGHMTHEEKLPEKRDRKKIQLFGWSYDPPADSQTKSHHHHRTKAKHAHTPGNGSSAPLVASQPAANSFTSVPSTASNVWSERKKFLQDRLRKINTQLQKIEAASAQASQMSFEAVPSSWNALDSTKTRRFSPPSLAPPSLLFHSVSHSISASVEIAHPCGMLLQVRASENNPTPARDHQKENERRDLKNGVALWGIEDEEEEHQELGGGVQEGVDACGNAWDDPFVEVSIQIELLACTRRLESRVMFSPPTDIPTYFDVIKNPMDLGTVLNKLDNGFYDKKEQWVADVKLVWENAMVFNPPGNDVHECAKHMSNYFENALLPSCKRTSVASVTAAQSVPSTCSPAASSGGGDRKILEMQRKVEMLQREVTSIREAKVRRRVGCGPCMNCNRQNTKQGGGSAKKKAPVAANKIMTFEEKRDLSMNIQKLNGEQTDQIIAIIRKRQASVLADDEEIEIDIDSLDNITLRELQKFVEDCLVKSRLKPAAASSSKSAASSTAVRGKRCRHAQAPPQASAGRDQQSRGGSQGRGGGQGQARSAGSGGRQGDGECRAGAGDEAEVARGCYGDELETPPPADCLLGASREASDPPNGYREEACAGKLQLETRRV
eukprot:267907-Hanusia_phi.AAC.1